MSDRDEFREGFPYNTILLTGIALHFCGPWLGTPTFPSLTTKHNWTPPAAFNVGIDPTSLPSVSRHHTTATQLLLISLD